MVASTAPERKAPARKRAPAKSAPKGAPSDQAESGLANQMRAMAGKLLIQSAREREFANIYRADDEARQLSDEEFAEVLTFTRAAFEMAMAFRGRSAKRDT